MESKTELTLKIHNYLSHTVVTPERPQTEWIHRGFNNGGRLTDTGRLVTYDETPTFIGAAYNGARKYRKWAFSDAGRTTVVAFRERKGVREDLEGTLPTLAGYNDLLQKHRACLVRHETTTPASAVRIESGVEIVLDDVKVCYVGFTADLAVEGRDSWYCPTRLVLPPMLVSPVRTAQTPHRCIVPRNVHVPPVTGYDRDDDPRVLRRIQYVDASGRPLFTHYDVVHGRFGHDQQSEWVKTCGSKMVAIKRETVWKNGVRDLVQTRESPVFGVWIEDLRSHADERPLGWTAWTVLREERRALKEALAMAVFHPARVERMNETYGEDWMERV
jgi:hypothetical protein